MASERSWEGDEVDNEGYPTRDLYTKRNYACTNCATTASAIDQDYIMHHPGPTLTISGDLGFDSGRGVFVHSTAPGVLTVVLSRRVLWWPLSVKSVQKHLPDRAVIYEGRNRTGLPFIVLQPIAAT